MDGSCEGGAHPRSEPRLPGPLTLERLEEVFSGCADFSKRTALLGGAAGRQVTLCYLNGTVRGERINDYLLRPLAQDGRLARVGAEEAFGLLREGALYNLYVKELTTLDAAATDLTAGWCLLFFPGKAQVLSFFTGTEEKRGVSEPENEPSLKGARDSFVESVLTNVALVRRRLRAPELKVGQHIVGRQSLTPVMVVYLEGIARPQVLDEVGARLARMDVDGVEAAGNLEEYLCDSLRTPFPLLALTQRPDRFCAGLLEGRVGILCEGLPLGYLVPGTVEQFFRTAQDRAFNWMAMSAVNLLRYLCAVITVLLPGLYIALVTFHPEAIPIKLALSIAAAKREVPFSTVFEVLILLVAFEVLQEAGLRLPSAIGATVSILGGLVVGNAAVEAHIVSPAVLVAVAIAGVAGYTQPSQDFAAALRLWRFLLAILASFAGTFALAAGCAVLIGHLAGLESFGEPYLAPFSAGGRGGTPDVTRPPLRRLKWRPAAGHNRRNQA